MRKTDQAYWDGLWKASSLPAIWDPRQPGIRHHVKRCLHRSFSELLAGLQPKGKQLLEIGCGRSVLLPYFAREFGLRVSGVDYSETGCAMARAILDREGVRGEIHQADVFAPPEALEAQFDVVVSLGVAEHFEDTTAALRAFRFFLKPGGLMVTIVPNTTGAAGLVQRLLNRPVFDIHVPLDVDRLGDAHRRAALSVAQSSYLVSSNFGICNLNGLPPRAPATIVKRLVLAGLVGSSAVTWAVEGIVGPFRPNRFFSAYVMCAARREAQ